MKKTTEERFWEKVDRRGPEDCWLWLGGTNKGLPRFGSGIPGKEPYGHRFSYELVNGLIPKNCELNNICGNKLCVNSAHWKTLTFEERFWRLVNKNGLNSCWEWLGGTNGANYGKFEYNGKNAYVHRITYQIIIGPIPKEMQLDHLCRNRICCNPHHLEPVTQKVNIQRGLNGIAMKTHCPQGHEYAGDNLIFRRGWRECRICKNQQNKKRAEMKRKEKFF